MRLPRQMIRVQRSEPSHGVVRNELRFVSYSSKNVDGQEPLEVCFVVTFIFNNCFFFQMHVVGEAFGALLSRLRELNIVLPEVEHQADRMGIDQYVRKDEVNSLRQRLAAVSVYIEEH